MTQGRVAITLSLKESAAFLGTIDAADLQLLVDSLKSVPHACRGAESAGTDPKANGDGLKSVPAAMYPGTDLSLSPF